ncbi:acyltransferase family protein [Streptomyces spectabilis]|uniref:Acyltransferase n=1 Tax=Streptomyces spectabilis TaxID=68270 RepID=A0A516RGA7_STRST|nr:acyltransferase [Streptomyces spectabilis]QDQ14692.1 acyltransferase [Streptomyces spectabilis]
MATDAVRPKTSRLPSLSGMRFIAALPVFAFHATSGMNFLRGDVGDFFTDIFKDAGTPSVSFFFVLSGFILTWSARPRDTMPDFWRRRMIKVYPNHLLAFAATVVIMLLASDPLEAKKFFTSLFLVQSWVPELPVLTGMNPVAWSLSCEVFFYLSFPLLLPLVRRLSVRGLWALGGVLLAVPWLVALLADKAVGGTPLLPGGPLTHEQLWFVYFFPPTRIVEFVLGIVVARLVLSGAMPRIGLVPAALFAVGGFVLNAQVPYLYSLGGTAAFWVMPLVVAGATADANGTRSIMRGRVIVKLGEMSFAFYLVHTMFVVSAQRWLVQDMSDGAALATLFGCLAGSLVVSYAMFTWVEEPLVRKFGSARRLRTGPPAPPAATAAAPLTAVDAKD